MKFDRDRVQKILVIKTGAIGDVLLATPVIENLRYNFPHAEINFLTQRFCSEVLKDNPFLNRLLTYDLSLGDSSLCLLKNINHQKYDLIIDLLSNPRTALITFNSDAKYRVGFPFGWRRFAYNIKVKSRSSDVHNIEFNLDALRRLGLDIITSSPKIYLNQLHFDFAEKFFHANNPEGKKVIGLNPCGTWATKVWPLDKFKQLAKLLVKDFKVFLFWGYENELKLVQEIKNAAGDDAEIIPRVNLRYMTALGVRCELFITNDSGPMHLVWAAGGKLLTIFGPTNPKLQGHEDENSLILRNEGLSCLGCNLTRINDCPNGHKCMEDISAEFVYDHVIGIIQKKII
ncbi:MAG: glycosyltransferase family 9 protein [Ignavibacteria bacterium]|nr:glycosyltransferase family 9 protein [Ignavibacteria bacterium]